MNSDLVHKVVGVLIHNIPWLAKCVKKIDVTDIGKQHDLTRIIKNISSAASVVAPSAQKPEQVNTEGKLNSKDEELFARIQKSAKGTEFDRLYRGEQKGEQAEKQLMNFLAFFPERIRNRCRGYSKARRSTTQRKGLNMLRHFARRQLKRAP